MWIDEIETRPWLLYTDGSASDSNDNRWNLSATHRGTLRDHVVGAVLIDPSNRMWHTFADIPPEIISRWLPKRQRIGQVELFGACMALATWATMLEGKRVLYFVDSDSATANLIRGYSPRLDSTTDCW